jgi:putative transposase
MLALNGVEDHVHALLQMPATITVAEISKHMKGNSSLMANERLDWNFQFRWSSAYAAFCMSHWNKAQLISYINNQKEHHAAGTTKISLELSLDQQLIPDS